MVLTAVAGLACGLSAIPFYSLSSFIAPLHATFGWSRGEIGVAWTIGFLVNCVTIPTIGHYSDRYGVRRFTLPSIVLLAAAMASLRFVGGSLVTLYVGYALVTVAGAATTSVTYTRVVNTWFEHSRGLALGITMMGGGVAAIVTPRAMAWVIGSWGWRAGYLACALATLLPLPLVWFLLFERTPVRPHQAEAHGRTAEYGVALAGALRDRRFWTMAAAAMLFTPTITAVVIHLLPILTDMGLTASRAASAASYLGAGIIVGRFISGILLDRLYGPFVGMLLFMMPAVGCLLLDSQWIAAAPYSVFIVGMSLGAEGDVFAYYVSRYFGLRSYAELFGWLFGVMSLAGALGPLLILLLPVAHGYGAALRLLAGLCILAALLLLTLGPYPDWNSESPMSGTTN